ncbi:MAG TPA: AsmA family protein [Candidatus Polarisedimenticolia bacterium]|nr:AsmA family protein [Candidatus Polarisedimenticolia bacterium]
MKKKLLVVLAIVVAVLIVVVVALPFLIDANRFKPTLETDLSNALGRKVEIGNIQLAILSGGVTVDNVSIADDPAFSRSPFLKAKQLTAGVELIPLIFSKRLEVRSITVTEPEVRLLRSPRGTWNFSSLAASGSKAAPSKGDSPSAPGDFSVAKLKISNGKVTVGAAGARGKTQTYQDVNFAASGLSYSSQFPFELTAKTPGGGTAKVEGKAGPLDRHDVSLTPFNAKMNVANLDLASTGFVDASSGLAGIVDFDGDLVSDGRQMTSKGTARADKIKVAVGGSPSRVPVNVNYATDYDLRRETGRLKQGDLHIGKALAHLTGTYDASGAATTVQMKLNGQGMPVTDLQGALPAAGITLPSGASLERGSLDVNLALSGPLDRLVITGPVNLSNGKLAGYNLKSKLSALSTFTGLGGGGGGADTDIQTLSGNLRVDPQGTHADNLNLVAPAIGTITGNVNISPAGQLNCKMLAKLAASAGGPASALTSALSSFTGGGTSQSGGIPFTITGTTSNPIFVPDVAGIAGSAIKSRTGTSSTSPADAASGILGDILGKKKTQ